MENIKNERESVLKEISDQLRVIGESGFAGLIPEVGSNLAYAVKNPSDAGDVAAIPGRIRNAMGRPVFLEPEFGASSHVASVIMAAMKYDSSMRSAMNMKYSGEVISACESLGLFTVFVDRMQEPEEIRRKEGASIPWVIETAYAKHGKVPDAIYHRGAVGKEAITHLLGRNPEEVVGNVMRLLERIS